jgi:hypothetical protein
MKRKYFPLFTFFAIFIIVSLACQIIPAGLLPGSEDDDDAETVSIEADESESTSPTPKPTPTLVPVTVDTTGEGPVLIIGDFEYTNDFYPEGYAHEHAVSLIEVTGFVLRDEEWEHPVESQVLGYVEMDFDNDGGTFRILLPARPAGVMNDVDHDGEEDSGVQIFAAEYTPNWLGGPFYAGNDPYLGWPSYLASVTVDTENQDEITGGKLIIWAPDDEQDFPTGFGEDGLLFTEDDPIAPPTCLTPKPLTACSKSRARNILSTAFPTKPLIGTPCTRRFTQGCRKRKMTAMHMIITWHCVTSPWPSKMGMWVWMAVIWPSNTTAPISPAAMGFPFENWMMAVPSLYSSSLAAWQNWLACK